MAETGVVGEGEGNVEGFEGTAVEGRVENHVGTIDSQLCGGCGVVVCGGYVWWLCAVVVCGGCVWLCAVVVCGCVRWLCGGFGVA